MINYKQRIEFVVISLLLTVLTISSIVYVVLYQSGWRYDYKKHTLVDISPVALNDSITLTLTEKGHTENYPITVVYNTMPSANTDDLFYNSDDFIKVLSIPKPIVRKAIKDFVTSVPREEFRKAYITPSCNYVATQNGKIVNVEALTESIVNHFPRTSTFNVDEFYKVTVDEDAEELQNIITKLNDCVITYTNGATIKAVDMEPVYDEETRSISFNEVLIEETVRKVCDDYDTVGKDDFKFNSTAHGEVTVKSGTYGNLTDTKEEVQYITDAINNLKPESARQPVMKQEQGTIIPNTYIEVDKENQHVYVYENGTLIMENDCVTGLPPKRTTPTGVYFVSEQMKNKTLRGPGYSSFVNRWMRLTNSGIGLHDATWRSQFGGEIYKHDGSHGCVNLPKQFAYDLYDWAQQHKKVCVIVF